VAAQELLVRCGMPIDLIVYCYLTGQPQPEIESYTQFLRMWYPRTDYAAFRELQRRGELTFFAWIRSWLLHRKVLPIFSIRDPWPFVVNALAYLKEKIGKVRRG
jgi:hypothetical protein